MTACMFLIIGLFCYWWGWTRAHSVVAEECRRLGSFYVGKCTFKCIEIKDLEQEGK